VYPVQDSGDKWRDVEIVDRHPRSDFRRDVLAAGSDKPVCSEMLYSNRRCGESINVINVVEHLRSPTVFELQAPVSLSICPTKNLNVALSDRSEATG